MELHGTVYSKSTFKLGDLMSRRSTRQWLIHGAVYPPGSLAVESVLEKTVGDGWWKTEVVITTDGDLRGTCSPGEEVDRLIRTAQWRLKANDLTYQCATPC